MDKDQPALRSEALIDSDPFESDTGQQLGAAAATTAQVEVFAEEPSVRRGRRAGTAPSRPRPQWQWATVLEVISETWETATLRLRLPSPTHFIPGQYYNVRYPVADRPRPIQRAYSIGSSPHPDPSVIDVTVKEMEGGLVSPKLVRAMEHGQTVEVRGPYGSFTWEAEEGGPLLMVAAGSGVVPFMSMIRYAVAKGVEVPMTLLFSSKSGDTIIYAQELAKLEKAHHWLQVVHSFTRSPQDQAAQYHRRIDAEMVVETLGKMDADPSEVRGFACGPPEMVETVEQALLAAGLDRDKVKVEKYD